MKTERRSFLKRMGLALAILFPFLVKKSSAVEAEREIGARYMAGESSEVRGYAHAAAIEEQFKKASGSKTRDGVTAAFSREGDVLRRLNKALLLVEVDIQELLKSRPKAEKGWKWQGCFTVELSDPIRISED